MKRSLNYAVLLSALASIYPAAACMLARDVARPSADSTVENSAWPHEPVGSTVIVDEPFNAITENGWQCGCTPLVTIVSDTTVPLSPLHVLQFSYPIGFQGGVGPGTVYYSIAGPWPTELYIGFWWKPSNPWQGHSSNVNKLMFITTGGTQDAAVLEMQGVGAGPFNTKVVTEFPTGATNWYENQGNLPFVTLGQWHRMEIHLRYADGLLEWWMDGLPRGRYQRVGYPNNGFDGFKFAPTWGGVGDVKTENDFFWFGHLHASRP